MTRTIEDGDPLVADEKYAPKPSVISLCTSTCTTQRVALVAALLMALVFFSSIGGTTDSIEIHQPIRPTEKRTIEDGQNQSNNNMNTQSSTDITVASLLEKLRTARKSLDERLKEGYGQYYEPMFYLDDGVSRGRDAFISGNGPQNHVSQDRFKRKLKIKILELMVKGNTKFVWVTGGHSATAGHGNFFDESYTAYLERAAKPAFEALGMGFEARNYAMGGTAAGPEIAMCSNEIFGTDADVLIWDYGMTDGNAAWRLKLYGMRAQLSSRKGFTSGRPIIIAYHTGNKQFRTRTVAALEGLNLGALVSDDAFIDQGLAAVPDTFGMTEDQIIELPPFVRNFKCNNAIESGEPYCQQEKFNNTMCTFRKGKTSWHPGWKWHSYMGNIAAFYLLENIEAALKEMEWIENFPPYLDKLQREEDDDYEIFIKQPASEDIKEMLPAEEREAVDFGALVNGSNYCHTAKLPAEIRHKGILTESSMTGFDTYDKGISLRTAKAEANPTDAMRLVFDESDREQCEVVVHVDYKDFFYVDGTEDWKKLVIPNNSELKEYGTEQVLKGIVAFCFTLCPWGKCPPGVLDREAFSNGFFQMQVNGVKVKALTKLDDCELMKHDDGYMFPLSPEGKVEIKAKVTADAGSYLRFSSFIVW